MENNIVVKQITIEMVNEGFIAGLQSAFPIDEESPDWDIEHTRRFIRNDKNILLIGYLNGNMAGYVYGHVLDRFDNEKQFLIYDVSTSKKYRRKGIMKTVIEYLLNLLAGKGFNEAWVLTNKSNIAAMALYSSTGAKPENEDDCMFVYKLTR